MGNTSDKVDAASVQVANVTSQEEPKKLKPCCACPETKQARDKCIIENGQENCEDLIQAHKQCMRKMGFNI